MMSLRIVAFRHAPVTDEGICYGRYEPPLRLPPGRSAAKILEAIGEMPISAVWSSPAERCLAPAARIARERGIPLRVDSRLHELSFGAWEGRSWREIEERDGWRLKAWMASWLTVAPPGGETVAQLTDRVRAWLEELTGESASCHLLIGHAGVIRALRVLAAASSWPDAMARPVEGLAVERFGHCNETKGGQG